jgi:hypothetical protein
MNLYQLLADVLVVLHAGYVGFVIFGEVLILVGGWRGWRWVRNFTFRAVHLAMILVVVAEALFGILCPLTEWEHRLRRLAGQTPEEGSFIGRWVHELLFVDLPQEMLTAIYCLFGLLVLGSMIFLPPRRPFGRKRACSQATPTKGP